MIKSGETVLQVCHNGNFAILVTAVTMTTTVFSWKWKTYKCRHNTETATTSHYDEGYSCCGNLATAGLDCAVLYSVVQPNRVCHVAMPQGRLHLCHMIGTYRAILL